MEKSNFLSSTGIGNSLHASRAIVADGTKEKARDINIGQKLLHKEFPVGEEISSLSKDEAL